MSNSLKENNSTRRSGIKIMASLILLLGSLSYVMLFAVINGSVGFICSMGVTICGGIGIAKALGENVILSYGVIITLAILFGVLRGLLRYIEQYSNHYIAFKLLAVLRDKIFSALRILCPAKLESKQKGSIIAMLTSDIETLEVFYAHTISPICIAVIVSICVFVFVAVVSSIYLALVALLGYIIVGIILPIISSKKLYKSGVNYRREFSSFNAYFLDSIKGVKDIVLHNAQQERKDEVNVRTDKLLKETKRLKYDSASMQALTECTITMLLIISFVVGVILVSSGNLSIGKMVIGIVAVNSSYGPVSAISALPSNLTQTFASGDRVLNLLEERPQVEKVVGSDFTFEHLEVDKLNFAYSGDEKVLNDICMHARKGEIVGIIGESGSGKSTFLKLLLRFWQKTSGSISYNGVDIDNIDSDSLNENVVMVSQSTYLFDMTIEDNLRIAKRDATMDEIISATKRASVHDLICSFPNGYNTKVGILGDNISAGEKQRIGLARAFLSGGELILLDEPTSNVDSINEGIILKALKEQRQNKSIILVSHRQSTMAIADRIYKIDNSNMEEVK